MNDLKFKNIEMFLVFSIFIVGCLVVFSVVPNSFSISLIGFGLSFIWFIFIFKNESFYLNKFIFERKKFLIGINLWLLLILFAVAIHAWARFVSPGFDLYWFSQAITNAKVGNELRVTSEQVFPTMLVHHWEPILYTIIPFTFLFSGAVSAAIWQALGFWFGTFGAWKLCNLVLKNNENANLKYLLTIFYVVCWGNINPLSFDVHPPVFGSLLFIPWIIYNILQKNRAMSIILLLILSQCGEIFIPIAPAYFVYMILENNRSIFRFISSFIVFVSGYALIVFYQKYVGPHWSGLTFSFANRYAAIGGDGLGILNMFIHHPMLLLSQLFAEKKIKTFLKIFVYYGFLPVIACFSKKYKLLVYCILLGCIPYFIQVGLATDIDMSNTNMHYISTMGSQWWCLCLFAIYTLSEEYKSNYFCKKIFSKNLIVALFVMLFFLNSSEWRKSPIYPFRGLIEREHASSKIREFLSQVPRDKGVLMTGVEWLCPLAADERYYLLCYVGHEEYLPIMPLDLVVASDDGLKYLYESLSSDVKNTVNANIIKNIMNNNLEVIGWKKMFNEEQKNSSGKVLRYSVWQKI